MIETLRIVDWVLVSEAELEFGPKLNVITGETGTGKSIVLGALSLLAGGRGSAASVRAGAGHASVEAVLRIDRAPGVARALREKGLAAEERELVLGRRVSANGRSRARVGGELVPVSTLAELLETSIEISSQHSSQQLLRPDVQGRLLDESGDLLPLREQVEQGVAQLRSLDAKLAALRAQTEERARRLDFLAFQVAEIDDLALAPGELEELGVAHGRLAHAERLLAEGSAALAALVGDAASGDTGAAEGAAGSAQDRLAAAVRQLDGLMALDPTLAPIVERLRGCEEELSDLAADLERQLSVVDVDPAKLAEVEDRLAAVEAVRRKYGKTEAEIAAFRARAAAELEAITGEEALADELVLRRQEVRASLAPACDALSRGRAKAAEKLGRLVEGSLAGLAMAGASFEVALQPVPPPPSEDEERSLPCGPSGAERIEFLFSANAGDPVRPLQRVASGGELSRLFLAVRNALRRSGAGMVLVFDEVDSGIGGRVAERIGRALAELARHHQVLCITHLPQIAAFADVHFRVQKKLSKGGRATAEVERIEGDVRVDEIARMAGGESVTAATRRHARELLGAKSPTA